MKTLGIYFSKTGVTKDVMHQLSESIDIDIIDVKNTQKIDFESYERMIIGTPVYAGMIPGKMARVIRENQSQFLSKPTYIYTVGGEKPNDYQKLSELSKIDSMIFDNAKNVIYAGGEFRYEALSFFPRLLLKTVTKRKMKNSPSKELPSLDKDAINDFIKALK